MKHPYESSFDSNPMELSTLIKESRRRSNQSMIRSLKTLITMLGHTLRR